MTSANFNNRERTNEEKEGEGDVDLPSLVTILGVRCFTIIKGERMSIGNGDLNVCQMDDQTILLFIPGIFQYAITKQFPSLV